MRVCYQNPLLSSRILFLVNDNLRKQNENAKAMGHFLQHPSFGRCDTHPSPSLPSPSSPGGTFHNWKHSKTCLHMQRMLQIPVCLFPRGSPALSHGEGAEDTMVRVRNWQIVSTHGAQLRRPHWAPGPFPTTSGLTGVTPIMQVLLPSCSVPRHDALLTCQLSIHSSQIHRVPAM